MQAANRRHGPSIPDARVHSVTPLAPALKLVESAGYACPLPHRADPVHPGDRVPLLQRVHRGAVLVLDDSRVTPAHTQYDGHNYYPTSRAGCCSGTTSPPSRARGRSSGPSWRRSSATRPGYLARDRRRAWPARCTTSSSLWASTRRGGRSLAEIARTEIGPVGGRTAAIAILFIVIIALAGLGMVVVNALAESAWGTFTIGATDPARRCSWASTCTARRKGHIARGDGHRRPAAPGRASPSASRSPTRPSARWFHPQRHAAHRRAWPSTASLASVLPVWMLLAPRDYLSAFMKIGTIALPRRRRHHRQPGAQACRPSRSSPPAAARSSRDRCSPSCSSPSPAARSRASTRSSRPARRRR